MPVKQLAAFGSIAEEIGVPDSRRADGREDHRHGRRPAARRPRSRVLPQRKWRIYVAPSSHTDIGYTDIQPKCAERHYQNIDTAIDLLPRVPRLPLEPGGRLAGGELRRTRASGQRLDDFYRCAREGKIGVQALYCNMLTGLCSHEEACRLTWFAHRL